MWLFVIATIKHEYTALSLRIKLVLLVLNSHVLHAVLLRCFVILAKSLSQTELQTLPPGSPASTPGPWECRVFDVVQVRRHL